ncbi:hypothetical protein NLI96_g5981 [Meripilus lineatus]|uniref:Uncharacterized protein n=1 Tax=Meripilus lineatus TaxID=2056292 RepID=A0AAD5V240_9APHY|nr:hypothetical protein NLI96_g5981 [Physisporinus lineatus]
MVRTPAPYNHKPAITGTSTAPNSGPNINNQRSSNGLHNNPPKSKKLTSQTTVIGFATAPADLDTSTRRDDNDSSDVPVLTPSKRPRHKPPRDSSTLLLNPGSSTTSRSRVPMASPPSESPGPSSAGSSGGHVLHPRPRPGSGPGSGDAKEVLRRARETISLNTTPLSCRRPQFIMDIILDSLPPVTISTSDELMETIDSFKRFTATLDSVSNLHTRSSIDSKDLEEYWRVQAKVWQGVAEGPSDYSPRRIYHVSAERSTASWDSGTQSDYNSLGGMMGSRRLGHSEIEGPCECEGLGLVSVRGSPESSTPPWTRDTVTTGMPVGMDMDMDMSLLAENKDPLGTTQLSFSESCERSRL